VIEILPSAHAGTRARPVPPPTPDPSSGPPVLYLQVGSFSLWDNAVNLRTRLDRAAFRPISIQSVLVQGADGIETQTRRYRVRIGPLKDIDEADRLTQQLAQHQVIDALIVVE
jgi:rare lipoprotein A